jgi:DNA-binding PadR family transcriptional regulator
MHGYRIKRILDDEGLRFWFPVEYASIYSVLRTLVGEGHVRVVALEREGQRPERTRYAITKAGRSHYADLLAAAWREPRSPAEPIQLALAAASDLDERRLVESLEQRIASLEARLTKLASLARSAPARAMVDRQLALTTAELAWARDHRKQHGGAG